MNESFPKNNDRFDYSLTAAEVHAELETGYLNGERVYNTQQLPRRQQAVWTIIEPTPELPHPEKTLYRLREASLIARSINRLKGRPDRIGISSVSIITETP
jgi:hypothetical protein